MSKQILQFDLPLTYTFSGNDRDASVSQQSESNLTVKLSGSACAGRSVKIVRGDNLHELRIARARIISKGAEGLSSTTNAASLILSHGNFSFNLIFLKFNEWETKDVVFPFLQDSAYDLKICSGSVVNIDDYNVQDAFVGESVSFTVEVELECTDRNLQLM